MQMEVQGEMFRAADMSRMCPGCAGKQPRAQVDQGKERILFENILNAVAMETGVSIREIKGEGRQRHIIEARHIAFYLMRRMARRSTPVIGRHMGARHHTTVLSSLRRSGKLIASDRDFAETLVRCEARALAAGAQGAR